MGYPQCIFFAVLSFGHSKERTKTAAIGRQKDEEAKKKAEAEAAKNKSGQNVPPSSAAEGFVNALGAGLIRIKNDLEKLWNGLTGDGFNTNDELKQMEEGKKQAIAAALGEWDKMKTEDMSQDILSNFNADSKEVTDAKIQAMRDAKLDTTQIEKQVAVLRQQDAAYKAQLKADSLAQQSAGKETYGYAHDTPINKWAGEALYSPEESNTGILKSIKGVFFDIVNAQANEWEAGMNKMSTPDVKDDLSKCGYTKGKDPWLDNMYNAYPDEVGSVIKADYNDKLIQNMLGPVAYKDYQKGGGAGLGLGLMDGINPAVYVKDILSAGFNSESTREARLQDVSNESIAYQMGFNKGYDSGSGMISSALLLTSFATMNPTAAAKSSAAQDGGQYVDEVVSGLSHKLQNAVINTLPDDTIIGLRSRPYGASNFDGIYPAKGCDFEDVTKFDNGLRKNAAGDLAVSDLDIAFVSRNGRSFNDFETNRLGKLINDAYGSDVVKHGDNFSGVIGGYKSAIDTAKKNENIFIFNKSGYMETGKYKSMINKFIDLKDRVFRRLRKDY